MCGRQGESCDEKEKSENGGIKAKNKDGEKNTKRGERKAYFLKEWKCGAWKDEAEKRKTNDKHDDTTKKGEGRENDLKGINDRLQKENNRSQGYIKRRFVMSLRRQLKSSSPLPHKTERKRTNDSCVPSEASRPHTLRSLDLLGFAPPRKI